MPQILASQSGFWEFSQSEPRSKLTNSQSYFILDRCKRRVYQRHSHHVQTSDEEILLRSCGINIVNSGSGSLGETEAETENKSDIMAAMSWQDRRAVAYLLRRSRDFEGCC
jgi:hypothetical protein